MEKFGKVTKEHIISEIARRFKNYPDFFVTSFSHTGVGEIEKLRKGLKKDSAAYLVAKNSMLGHAMKESGLDENLLGEIRPHVSGCCGVLFTKDDPVAMARMLVNFSKDHENFKIEGGVVNKDRVSAESIKLLATLPPKNVLLAMVASGMKSPISGFVGLLSNLLRSLVGVLDAVEKKKAGQ